MRKLQFLIVLLSKKKQDNIHFSQIHEGDGIVGFAILALEAFENNGGGT